MNIKKEIISIAKGKFISNVDGEISFPNLDNYWISKLIKNNEDENFLDDCCDISKEKKYSYINLCSNLVHYYGLVDSCWNQNLVPSMTFNIGKDIECWIGFPNSNNDNDDNEEWNYFTIDFSDDSKYPNEWEQFNIRLDTIEEVLSFIKSNWNLSVIFDDEADDDDLQDKCFCDFCDDFVETAECETLEIEDIDGTYFEIACRTCYNELYKNK